MRCSRCKNIGPRKPRLPRGQGEEAKKVQNLLNGFDVDKCIAKKQLDIHFSTCASFNLLKAIASIACDIIKNPSVKLNRLAKRDYRCLIKWFNDNWEIIGGLVTSMVVTNAAGKHICLKTELDYYKNKKNN